MKNARNYSQKLNGKLNATGTTIKLYRTKLKLSRQALSDKLILMGIDIPAQSIYDIEVGDRGIMDFELCAIAKCLKISSDELLNEFMQYLNEDIKLND